LYITAVYRLTDAFPNDNGKYDYRLVGMEPNAICELSESGVSRNLAWAPGTLRKWLNAMEQLEDEE